MPQRRCRLFHVDAFTRQRFCGNPAIVVLDADSFLMKGETLDSHTGWCGNPAKMVRSRFVVQKDNAASRAESEFEPRMAAE